MLPSTARQPRTGSGGGGGTRDNGHQLAPLGGPPHPCRRGPSVKGGSVGKGKGEAVGPPGLVSKQSGVKDLDVARPGSVWAPLPQSWSWEAGRGGDPGLAGAGPVGEPDTWGLSVVLPGPPHADQTLTCLCAGRSLVRPGLSNELPGSAAAAGLGPPHSELSAVRLSGFEFCLPLISCVSGQVRSQLSVPQFPHLYSGDDGRVVQGGARAG